MRLRKNTWIPQYLKTVDFLPGHKVSAEEWNALFNLSRIQGNNNAEGIKLLMDTVEGAIELPSILYDYDSRIKEMEDKVKGFNDEHVIDLVSEYYVSKDDYTNATGSIKILQESLVEVEKKITDEAIIDTVKGTYVTKTDFETATKDISLLEEKLTEAEQKITDEAITSTVSAYFYKKTEIDEQVLEQNEFLQSEIEQTSKSILSTVEETYTTKEDSDKRFARVEQTVDGLTITTNNGTTQIDGGKIAANSIKVNSIDAEELKARVGSYNYLLISSYNTDKTALDSVISAAQSTADSAGSAASSAQTKADSAYGLANTANTTAGDAQTKANTANTVIANWCYNNNTTYIDGGNIYTKTITADKLSVSSLEAICAKIGGFTIGSTYLANNTTALAGSGNSVYVGLDGISCGTAFKVTAAGALNATSGNIGGAVISSTALTSAGYVEGDIDYDSNGNISAGSIKEGIRVDFNSYGFYTPQISITRDYIHVKGYFTIGKRDSSEEIGNGSIVQGSYCGASGVFSYAQGVLVYANGKYSHAEGMMTQANGQQSHSEGSLTLAEGSSSHAEGYNTNAYGNYSHSEGEKSEASGEGAHAEGYDTGANGIYSHSEGYRTIASGQYQHVSGKYNIEDTANTYAYIIGNGSSNSARSNAHTVDWSGNAWYAGTINAAGGFAGAAERPTYNGKPLALYSDVGTGGGSSVDLSGYAKLRTYNDFVHDGNEITMVPAGYSQGSLYFNYRTASGSQDGNINNYLFCNGRGGTSGVTLTADAFAGTAARATADGSGNNIVSTYATKTDLNKKANDFTIELYNGTGGNPKPVRFASFNYSTCNSENGISAKISMVSGHGNGTSYAFLQDVIIRVNHSGGVEVDNFKYYGADTGTYDGATRQYGDIFWLVDTTNKIVDFYVLMGQYARLYQTPWKRLTYSSGGTVTQHTSCTVYSSGTKAWANNSNIALVSDIPSGGGTVSGDYLPLSGGLMTGSIKFQASSLPQKSLEYVCGIDAFASGGEMGWQSKADFLAGYATTAQLGSYLPLSGGALSGALTFANGTMNTVGDDVQIGDQNVAGTLCVKGTNGTTAIQFMPYNSNAVTAKLMSNDVSSYGGLRVTGLKGSYHGILFGDNNTGLHVMSCEPHQGLYNESTGRWILYYNRTYNQISIGGASTTQTGYTVDVHGNAKVSSDFYAGGALTVGGKGTISGGAKISGRYAGGGDDEGLVIGRASNNYAGLCLGEPSGVRSVFYLLPDNSAAWRWYNGSTSTDIRHPGKSGTIALISDITDAGIGSGDLYLPLAGGTVTGTLTVQGVVNFKYNLFVSDGFQVWDDGNICSCTSFAIPQTTNTSVLDTVLQRGSSDQFIVGSASYNTEVNNLVATNARLKCLPTYSNTTTYATNVYVGTSGMFTRTTNTSSRTIKHDIESLTGEAIRAERLYDLDVVQFKYNDNIITDMEDARYGKTLPGFIIEDMDRVYPIAVDKPGEDVKEWSWNAQYMIPPMLKLIQDQHKEDIRLDSKIDSVRAELISTQTKLDAAMMKIAELENEIDELKAA